MPAPLTHSQTGQSLAKAVQAAKPVTPITETASPAPQELALIPSTAPASAVPIAPSTSLTTARLASPAPTAQSAQPLTDPAPLAMRDRSSPTTLAKFAPTIPSQLEEPQPPALPVPAASLAIIKTGSASAATLDQVFSTEPALLAWQISTPTETPNASPADPTAPPAATPTELAPSAAQDLPPLASPAQLAATPPS